MLQLASEQGDLYISYWIKLQPDLMQNMTFQNWRGTTAMVSRPSPTTTLPMLPTSHLLDIGSGKKNPPKRVGH